MSKRTPEPITAEGEDVVEVWASAPVAIPGTYSYAVRFPDMMDYKARFSTFAEWPESKAQHPRVMAQAGWFYNGNGDCVQCFHCGRELERWVPTDGAWEEHARASPICPFVIAQKGEQYVHDVQTKQAKESAQICDKNHVEEKKPIAVEKNTATEQAAEGTDTAAAVVMLARAPLSKSVLQRADLFLTLDGKVQQYSKQLIDLLDQQDKCRKEILQHTQAALSLYRGEVQKSLPKSVRLIAANYIPRHLDVADLERDRKIRDTVWELRTTIVAARSQDAYRKLARLKEEETSLLKIVTQTFGQWRAEHFQKLCVRRYVEHKHNKTALPYLTILTVKNV
ncbi:baculoviral IAP repeat-containing protein 3-like [Paramacrobiotus metropolitanus]|uniref:baculoviral IAP repeat-containing protein 3-like n=1 Tax=Paramacrobiotus metropolitanus TaxID=2943436 RepID=UPI002445C79F|nr:baculoviral IAP repeat-containing protein 3-like [Paramacrobiotus metropolitanus]